MKKIKSKFIWATIIVISIFSLIVSLFMFAFTYIEEMLIILFMIIDSSISENIKIFSNKYDEGILKIGTPLLIMSLFLIFFLYLAEEKYDALKKIFKPVKMLYVNISLYMSIVVLIICSSSLCFGNSIKTFAENYKKEILKEANLDLNEQNLFLPQDSKYEKYNFNQISKSCKNKTVVSIATLSVDNFTYRAMSLSCFQKYNGENDKWKFKISEYDKDTKDCFLNEKDASCIE